MIINTEIIFYDDEKQTGVKNTDEFIFDLKEVCGMMPGKQDKSTTIIFLYGRDIEIKEDYRSISQVWRDIKSKIKDEFLT